MTRILRARSTRAWLGASVAVLAWHALATAAVAQSAPAEAQPEAAAPAPHEAEIVVTGSRLGSNFNAPTPVTAVTNERLEALSITNVGEALTQLPSFRSSSGPAQQATAGGPVGARLLDLRGLDPRLCKNSFV
ncbi:Plug domain-containing protein [Sphingomonas sp.]|uniref:Plug domain-containing protein n=1 Tax=Sphingomonas sp. TaxID=28214 RepID=UPI0025802586|nr:Plug domain-containing protein [Sphingomonas sp.]